MRQKIIGVYRITNTITGGIYIGSSIDTLNRWWQHRKELRSGRHHNDKLKKAFKKYGEDAFVFEVVEECTLEDLQTREQAWILGTNCLSRDGGYNLTDCVDSPNRGKKMSPETCAKMSMAKKGLPKPPFTEEHRNNIREAWKIRRLTPVSQDTRDKLSSAGSGRPRPPSFVEKMRGRVVTEESRENMRRAQQKVVEEGRHGGHTFQVGHCPSQETTEKRVKSFKATIAMKKELNGGILPVKPVSEETKSRMSAAQKKVKHRPHSKETKEKMRLAWEKRRG